jgi:hypothetical protein
MFIRKKPNRSGLVSIQVIDKSSGKYKMIKTIGSSSDGIQIERLVQEGELWIKEKTGLLELDFSDSRPLFEQYRTDYSPGDRTSVGKNLQ